MNPLKLHAIIGLLVACVVFSRNEAVSALDFPTRTVALSWQNAPGTTPGTIFSGFQGADLNAFGKVSFLGYAYNPDVPISAQLGQSIWSEGFGSLSLVAHENMPAPGANGAQSFNSPYLPTIADSGRTAFFGHLNSGDSGYWSGNAGGLSSIAVTGTPAGIAGIDAGIVQVGHGINPAAMNSSGQTAFFARIDGPDVPMFHNEIIFKEVAGQLSIGAQAGMVAPGTGGLYTFRSFGQQPQASFAIPPALNNRNEIAFYASVQEVVTSSYSGIWAERQRSLHSVAQTYMAAPGTDSGTSFYSFSNPRLNDAGQTAFSGFLTGNVNLSNDTGIWSEGSGALSLVAREGAQAAGLAPGVRYGELWNPPILNHQGRAAFEAGLTGTGVTSANNSALWFEGDKGLTLVTREGNEAPGVGPGVVFDDFPTDPNYGLGYAMNASGLIVFNAKVRGPGITFGDNDSGVWAMDASGGLFSIVHKGVTIEVAPGDFRVVRAANSILGSGGEDGGTSALNDAGQIAVYATFTDFSEGIFVLTVPEPGTLILMMGAGLTLIRRRRFTSRIS